MWSQSGGASTSQIGEAVKARQQYKDVDKKIVKEANAIVHGDDKGVKNKYTTDNYAPSKAAEKFLNKVNK